MGIGIRSWGEARKSGSDVVAAKEVGFGAWGKKAGPRGFRVSVCLVWVQAAHS